MPVHDASSHRFVADRSVSIARGIPLSEETGIGPLTLGGFLRDVTSRHGGREALVHRLDDGSRERWSYCDLWDRSCEVARSLIASGLGKGERVGVLMTNRAEFLSAVFGTALAGGVATPLSTFSTPAELEYLIAHSAVSCLLFERGVLKKDFLEILGDLDPQIGTGVPGGYGSSRFPFLRELVVLGGERRGAVRSWREFLQLGQAIGEDRLEARSRSVVPADPGALFFSSGSTARPKGILSAHQGVSLQMWRMGRQQGLGDGVRSWTANGFFWSGNFSMIIGGTLSMGGSLILQRTFHPVEALDLFQSERVTFPFAWPHQWEQLTAAPNWQSVDLSSATFVDMACPLASHPTVTTSWIEPRHCYGNTETFTLSAAFKAMTTADTAGESHGIPLPGNLIKIVDPLMGHAVALGQNGEIAVKGPTLMLGYLGTPLFETLDEEGYFRTGDGGRLDEEGRLHWQGRLNDIIKTGGANVSPLEIDEAIRALPGIKMSQTVGVPHETLGEIVVACVVFHAGAEAGEDVLREKLRTVLASYKVPRRIIGLDEAQMGLTGSAKIKTSELRALAANWLANEPG
ncbi:class I adenylate-forming enzyme family protein [Novosphingobium sp. ST904]|uniref:class I adenylate-forming enzyme family protein n=1 Tax=Novosphingobium sp. ST904 TaxID=1684385 RepID=UPI0006C8A8D7|nr:class I adenylate-forming enzyme family protein [Novosphingobium sp. ST904]KPH62579.1 AMP-dependent synthetase [Novosphingobium sp. ST904]TCM33040.1 fatty-acyl-CoA synthase [Novosphingobium sp. ST904]